MLLVIVDDLGWRDLGVYGSTFHEAPAIDALAAWRARFGAVMPTPNPDSQAR